MADQLFISVRTVEGHRKNLLEKTGTPNSVSLAVFAILIVTKDKPSRAASHLAA